ncbi:hypothetical protein BGZ51_007493 [Haplosporangium sp. Z 767]|nr:hypothetical protein BGZ51_007493 [Haplosporangium sp. Z 767]KAF9194159.1 hypothetical protein BGZ50_006638 [Haplosporangium sp. Z 11]
MMASALLDNSLLKDLAGLTSIANNDSQTYPSPTLSPVATFHPTMELLDTNSRRRSSVKSLTGSTNAPASPLDALVMALEATAEEMEGLLHVGRPSHQKPSCTEQEQEDEDPNATVPSSPTFFMKKTSASDNTPSLHQLPTLMLPQPATASHQSPSATLSTFSVSVTHTTSGFDLSTHPGQHPDNQTNSQRRMSTSSQGSASSVGSNNERNKTFACTIGNCEKKFYQVAHLRIHERCHTGTRPFVCRFDGCERSFTQLGNLKTHERKHTGERPYKCQHPGCDKTFTQLGNLKTHERIHDEVKPFMCRLIGCGKTFSQFGNLKTHTAKMHPDVCISDEDLAVRTTARSHSSAKTNTHGAIRPSQGKGPKAVQVIAHFNPYQRRPIRPQKSEEAKLLKEIRAMLQHEQRVRALTDGSEVSDEMDE